MIEIFQRLLTSDMLTPGFLAMTMPVFLTLCLVVCVAVSHLQDRWFYRTVELGMLDQQVDRQQVDRQQVDRQWGDGQCDGQCSDGWWDDELRDSGQLGFKTQSLLCDPVVWDSNLVVGDKKLWPTGEPALNHSAQHPTQHPMGFVLDTKFASSTEPKAVFAVSLA